jgi:hypothetical protein
MRSDKLNDGLGSSQATGTCQGEQRLHELLINLVIDALHEAWPRELLRVVLG